jgi:predicted DNA-binding ribbon-helix-helix protein
MSKTWVQPRSLLINGHATSFRLEPEMWGWLRQIAAECGTSAPKLIAAISKARNPARSLSSALRVSIAGYFAGQVPRYGLVDPSTKLTFRIEKPRKPRSKQRADMSAVR